MKRTDWNGIALLSALLIPSVGAALKYGGVAGLVGYLLLASGIGWVAWRYAEPLLARLPERWLRLGLLASGGVALLLFALIYPIADGGAIGGGTDRDEALEIAVSEVAAGRYPYYPRTYIGAPISPLPGALVLASPFVALGNSAYQNLFWLPLVALVVLPWLGWQRLTLATGLLFALCLGFWQEWVTGGDLLANGLYLTVALALVVRLWSEGAPPRHWQLGAIVLLGCALASRANLVLALIPLAAWLAARHGWRTALVVSGGAAAVATLLTLPFYLYDPAGFSPLHTRSMISRFEATLPFAQVLIPLAMLALSGFLAWRYGRGSLRGFWYAVGLPQLLPVVLGLMIYLVQGDFVTTFPSYALLGLWPTVLAALMLPPTAR